MNRRMPRIIFGAVIIALIGGSVHYFASRATPEHNGRQIQSPPPIQPTAETPAIKPVAQTSFDGCGEIEKYANEPWYSDFIENLSESGVSADTVAEACLFPDKSLFIAITDGSYCAAGSIHTYDVSAGTLAKAIFDDKGRGCVSWPTGFGKRAGDIMTLQGSGGDAGCRNTMYYDFDFVEKRIELKKEYGICEGDETGTWQSY